MARLHIEVVYATPFGQDIVHLVLEGGARAIDALGASGFGGRHPELRLKAPRLGIFGREVGPDTALADGDRVEVYRPLAADPKEARRARVRAKRRR
jgi:uncharacterized protein